ncbi:hypothetical protein F2Q69_00055657 [Brassica cretica]|uniref:SWIM-type domain-containing protein n=1 Tax=Brassica cretica TaxID=69181 RepID=A0A8S9MRR6_BRACR|nr:hypothetical protein F2Q69_00055657 [Brassica cretica]
MAQEDYNLDMNTRDALVSKIRLTAVRRKFSFRIYKSTKTLLVATCRVNGCGWKIRASVKHEKNSFWVTKSAKPELATYLENADVTLWSRVDGWRFFTKGGKKDSVVDLEHQKCDCGVYAVEKIPCSHAIAAGSYAGLHISTLVCPVYSKDTLFARYSENMSLYWTTS